MSQLLDSSTPNQDGFSMPGEFKTHDATWVVFPYRRDVYRLDALPVQKEHVAMCNALAEVENLVHLIVQDETQGKLARELGLNSSVHLIHFPTDDAWIRDTGPLFLTNNSKKEVRAVEFRFNAWGDKCDVVHDNLLKENILNFTKTPRYKCDMNLEGGSVHIDGEGTLLTTEECLLNKNRNPDLSREQIEHNLRTYLGVSKIIWLPKGVYGDVDTDGHIDNICCFLQPGVVGLHWIEDESHPQHEISKEALQILLDSTDAKGRKLRVVKLHGPRACMIRTREDLEGIIESPSVYESRKEGDLLPGTYVNFYIANQGVIVPQFGDEKSDHDAIEVLRAEFPGRRVIGIKSREILLGGGNIHCQTQQQPCFPSNC